MQTKRLNPLHLILVGATFLLASASAWAANATLTVGTAEGKPGEPVTLPILLDTQGTSAISVGVVLEYDGSVLTNPAGQVGAVLPSPPWNFQSVSPRAGRMRLLALAFGQPAQVFNGEIFRATFTIAAGAGKGEVPVRVSLVELNDATNVPFTVATRDGAVTVVLPPEPVRPTITISSPAEGFVITGKTVEVVYRTTGDIAAFGVDHIHLQLDSQPEIRGLGLEGSRRFEGVDPGSHRIRMYLAQADHTPVEGTEATVGFQTKPEVVEEPPTIAEHPESLTVGEGEPASFQVRATGTNPLRYQWQKAGADIAEATQALYRIASATLGDAGAYRCVVTDRNGKSATSQEAILTVSPRPIPQRVEIRLGDGSGEAGESVTVPLEMSMEPDRLVAVLVLKIRFDGTRLTFDRATGGAATRIDGNEVVMSEGPEDGATPGTKEVTVVVVDMAISDPGIFGLNDGEQALITFQVNEEVATGPTTLEIVEWMATDHSGANISNTTLRNGTLALRANSRPRPAALTIRSPEEEEELPPGPVTVIYQSRGDLTEAAHVHLQLDDQPEVMGLPLTGDHTFRDVAEGRHAVRGWLVRADHTPLGNSESRDEAHFIVSEETPENQPPEVTILEEDLEIFLNEMAHLRGAVTDDGLPDPPHRVTTLWSTLSGPGEVTFEDPSALETMARFSQVGSYRLRLTANDGELAGHAEVRIQVRRVVEPPRPQAPEITEDPKDQEAREGQTATFRVQARGAAPLRYQWEKRGEPIPDATEPSYTTPPVTLADDGTEFRCIVSNEVGTATSESARLTVLEETGIQLSVTATPTSGTAPLTVAFDVTATMTRGRILRYEWDFREQGHYGYRSSETGDVEYTYTAPGRYQAKVRVIGTRGRQETYSLLIEVTPNSQTPELNLSADPLVGQAPLTVTFRAEASSPSGIDRFDWDFNGDGQVDYTVQGSGETSQVSRVLWEYTHTEEGAFNPMVTVTDLAGLTATRRIAIFVSAHPQAPAFSMNARPMNGTAPLTVHLRLDPIGEEDLEEKDLDRVSWDFEGDDTVDRITRHLEEVEYTYRSAGRYRPIAIVLDRDHRGSRVEGPEITVEQPTDGLEPTAGFTVTPDEGPAPLEVVLTDTSTSPVPMVERIWLGDGGRLHRRTEGAESITYTFHHPGPTRVDLIVRNEAGLISMASHQVYVTRFDSGGGDEGTGESSRIRIVEPEPNAVLSGTVPVVVTLGPRLHPTSITLEGGRPVEGGKPPWVPLATLTAPPAEPRYVLEWDTTTVTTSHPRGAFYLRVRVEDPLLGSIAGPVLPVRIAQAGEESDINQEPTKAGERRRWKIRIYAQRTQEVELGDDLVLGVPAGATTDDGTLTVALLDPSQVPTPIGGENPSLVAIGIYHRLDLTEDETGQLIHDLEQPIRLEIRYPDADQDGFVDGLNIPETSVKIYTQNTDIPGAPWGSLADFSLDPVANRISGTTSHLSLFGLGGIIGGAIEAAGGGDGGGILGALGGGGGGCFIATAAFGTPMAPELDLLREFRDEQLLTRPAGQAFVRWYYAHGPAAARFIENKPALRWAVRQALKPILWTLKRQED